MPVSGMHDVVVTTSKLSRRVNRTRRYEAENAALVRLVEQLSASAPNILDKIVEAACSLCRAHAAGISLLERRNTDEVLRTHAVTGQQAPKPGSLAPREFSPSGIAIDQQSVQLFSRPERHFPYLTAWPRIHETLVAPLKVDGRPVGTLWVISHDDSKEFDSEDARLLSSLSQFASLALRSGIHDEQVLRERAAENDRDRNVFLSTLAHELRNPLAPIRNAVQIMREADNDLSTVAAARNMIERQLKHLVRLIDDVVDVSRVLQGNLELRTERVDLGTAILAALDTHRPLLESRQQRVNVQRPETAVYVDADLTRLAQIFGNLLNNAAKFSPPGAEIQISAEVRNDCAVVTIADAGIGIPQEMIGRIFNLFTQERRTDHGVRHGLGIGLTLVKRLVELHHGTVEAVSDGENRGSRFIVSLPLSEAPARSAVRDANDANQQAVRQGGMKILVADDNKDSAMSLEIMLRLDGHDVQTAYDGVDALEVAERFRPDVILLDIGMPRLDGYATAFQLRQRPWASNVRLVALTGWGQDEDKRRAREAGFDYHLVKPVDPELLARALAQKNPPAPGNKPTPDVEPDPPPIKEPNPPDEEVQDPGQEVPKVGSRDAPGG
jgi:signal transduction histidine kinase/ActR/RegA family two-component response regulator